MSTMPSQGIAMLTSCTIRRPRRARALLALAVVVAIGSCSADEHAPASDTAEVPAIPSTVANAPTSAPEAVAPLPPRPPLPPARDADQAFLRHMLDHHETVLALVHAQMMEPAGHAAHGGSADPTAFDAKLDAEKLEMLALLSRLYGESYSPWAAPDAPREPAGREPAATHTAGADDHGTSQTQVATRLRDGIALVDRFLPRLTRPQVRDVARRVRASHLELAREAQASSTP